MEIRSISDAEITAFRDALLTTFGHDLDVDPDGDARFRALIEDVPAALALRTYTTDGRRRFALEHTTYELTVEDGHGRCTATTHEPELRFARTTLSSLYLGATTATKLARADIVRGDADAIATADRLFASTVAAWCPEIF